MTKETSMNPTDLNSSTSNTKMSHNLSCTFIGQYDFIEIFARHYVIFQEGTMVGI